MYTTSLTLLERLRDRKDVGAWRLLLDLYTPLIQRWFRTAGLQAADIDDLTQEVLTVVTRRMPEFTRSHRGAFRGWLKTIAVHKLGDHRRNGRNLGLILADWRLAELEDSAGELSREWDRQHDEHIARQLLDWLKAEFTTTTWEAFRLAVLQDQPTAAVAQELGMSANAVLIAKSRVLSRLRRELRHFTDI